MNHLSNYPWQEDHLPAESWDELRHQLFGDDLAFPDDFWDRHDGDMRRYNNKRSMGDSMRLGKRAMGDSMRLKLVRSLCHMDFRI